MSAAAEISLSGAKSHLRVAISRALAEALITGIDQARQEGHPLSQLQQIDMATMAAMTAHTVIYEMETTLATEAALLAEVRS